MSFRHLIRGRGLVATIVGLLLAGVLFTPAIAHHTATHTRAELDNHLQLIRNQRDRLVNQRTAMTPVVQSLTSFAATGTDSSPGDPGGDDFPLFSHGPMSWFMRCVVGDSGVDRVEVIVTSTEPFHAPGIGLQPAGGEVVLASRSSATGDSTYGNSIDGTSAISELDGTIFSTGVERESLGLGLNVFGNECLVNGFGYRQSTAA